MFEDMFPETPLSNEEIEKYLAYKGRYFKANQYESTTACYHIIDSKLNEITENIDFLIVEFIINEFGEGRNCHIVKNFTITLDEIKRYDNFEEISKEEFYKIYKEYVEI